ncbi:uncharacterized protein [Paramisgurnus dabryanus]|uniref:uncharacterized protein n=1 Tax=Paramisgurnus dabryanus TaxID=90735 RepID=UPI0031F34F88
MGNCLTRCSSTEKSKMKEETADNEDQSDTNKKTSGNEDILYASIDHNNPKSEKQQRDVEENDCDYAIVKMPDKTKDRHKSNEDCSDDYVLMA